MRNHDSRRGAGDGGHGVVFGHPEASISQSLDRDGHCDGLVQGLGRGGTRRYRGEVEDGEGNHWGHLRSRQRQRLEEGLAMPATSWGR